MHHSIAATVVKKIQQSNSRRVEGIQKKKDALVLHLNSLY